MKRYFSLLVVLALTATAWAQHTDLTSYYSAADGKCGATLKTALFNIITSHTNIGYDGLWTAYQTTDKRSDGKLYDIYSNTTNYVIGGSAQGANYTQEGESYNREHLIPQSVFNEKSPMKADAHFVYPADGYINNMRSNYPFGTVGTVTTTSNNDYSKLGSAASSLGYSGTVFEPNDEYKGDIARAILYFVTCYESELTSSEWKTFAMFDKTSYPSLTTWATTLLLAWSAADPVSQKEIDRNDAVDALQGNRNPFVDYPGIEQYIWGDMKTTNVNLADLASGSASVIRPVISPNGGTFSSSQSVTITCATSGATIHYTLDGSTPTNSSTAYTGPIALTSTTTLKAIAYVGSNASSVATATFTKSSSGGSVGTLLYESFSGYTSSNDGTAAIATDNANLDYSSWTSFDRLYLGKNGCGKMGSGNYAGSMTASNLPLTGDGTLTFKVQKYGTDTGTLGVTVTGATATGDLTVTPESDWTDYTVNLTAGTGNVSITFATSAKRAYIDEIRLVAAGSEVTAPDAPVFSPNGGSFSTSQDVTITCATAGTTIYYTTDGSIPTQNSNLYSGVIALQATTTINAVAIDGDGNISEVATATFTKTGSGTTETQLLYESFSGYTGASDSGTAFTTSSSELDYNRWGTLTNIYPGGTTEGYGGGAYGKMGTSSKNGSLTASGIALTGAGTLTFMVRKWDSVTLNVTVTGATATGDVSITPTDTWTKYTVNLTEGNGDVSITFATSSKRARIDEIEIIAGTAEEDTPADPTFGVVAGTYLPTQTITLACATTGANIYYTTDGSEPSNSNGTLYTAAFTLPSVGIYTVKAIAVSSGGTKYSSVVSRTYTIEEATPADPTFSPAAGTYKAAQSITISCATSGAVIHYTTDGTTPTASSPTYSSAISLSTNGTYTVKAIAVSSGGTKTSDVVTATYTINITTPPAAPRFSLAGGTYNTPQSIQVVAEEGCTITYYWGTNSSNEPSVNYTGAVVLNSAGTYYLKAYATKDDVDSDVTEATYIYTPASGNTTYSATEFVKATSTTDLVENRPCLIVCEDQNLALQTIASNKGTGTSVTISSSQINISGLDTKPAVYTLGISTVSSTNYWTFKNGSSYIKAKDSSKTDLDTESSLSDNSRWTISISSDDATIASKVGGSRQLLYQISGNCIRYYATSNASSNSYNNLQLYVGKEQVVSSEPTASKLTAGLYRIKDAAGYLCVDTNGTLTKTSDASDLGTIFKVTGSDGTYQLEAQGKSIASYSKTIVTLGDNAEVSLTHGTKNEYISVGSNTYINADGKAAAVGAEWTFEEITTENAASYAPTLELKQPTSGDVPTGDALYSTFYADFPFTVTGDDVIVYTMNSGYKSVEVPANTTIPAGTAVLIQASSADVKIVPKYGALNVTLPDNNKDNILRGTCQPVSITSLGLKSNQKVFVFNGKNNTPAFYPLDTTKVSTLSANRVYIIYPAN